MALEDQALLRGRGAPAPEDDSPPVTSRLLGPAVNTQPPPEGGRVLTVQAYPEQTLNPDGGAITNWIDQSGNYLNGPPDENGMGTINVDKYGMLATQPRTFGLGPPYNNTGGAYAGAPLAPPSWMGDSGGDGRGGDGGAPGTLPPGALNFSGGNVLPTNWQDFSGTDTSTGGGFFTMDDVFARQGKDVPGSFQAGSSLPSTNNYRLFTPEYQHPNFIMRNGRMIDLNSNTIRSPFGTPDSEHRAPSWNSGANVGVPSAYSSGGVSWAITGWPGQLNNWGFSPGGT